MPLPYKSTIQVYIMGQRWRPISLPVYNGVVTWTAGRRYNGRPYSDLMNIMQASSIDPETGKPHKEGLISSAKLFDEQTDIFNGMTGREASHYLQQIADEGQIARYLKAKRPNHRWDEDLSFGRLIR